MAFNVGQDFSNPFIISLVFSPIRNLGTAVKVQKLPETVQGALDIQFPGTAGVLFQKRQFPDQLYSVLVPVQGQIQENARHGKVLDHRQHIV